ncbi:beta-ketoacyl synthase N-terminal-like domain-containing protein [Nocardiopsis metallicus]|uniref:Acyl transferase domain-containing protein n=1 Tax=Nocardiopsis metallicus TaxID=179819 RepID=A0A840W3N4_9ACTN|nr:type I polyketide synthase [Nocardiopsis metallicus]MBB5491489.1 acyl transferase domain-containing protein [Nocardiopsis metallicus]
MTTPDSSVAVVGLSCRLPGHIRSPQAFWDALVTGRDLVTDHTDAHPRADILPAAILTETEQGFDAAHFGFSPTEVAAMDPQQQMLLELVDEAFQDAGMALTDWRGKRVGLWVGSSCLDQALLRLGPGQGGTMVDTAGALPSMLANRLSRHRLIDWRGPSEALDTACSASLVAAHRAHQALLTGEVDLAVVASANTLRLDTHTRMFAASRVLSDDGCVHPFDQGGSGFVRGEGGGALILQRTADCPTTGTRPRALVAASLTNCDGAGAPIGTPNVAGQIDLLTRTYAQAGLAPDQVDYVEGHATGTAAGDAAESRALGRVLGRARPEGEPLLVGGVKPNVGHLEGGAGLIALIKVVLSLEHGVIPPTIHHTHPLPALQRMGLQVPTTARPWPQREHTPTAGVSAFGFGGTNAHLILQQAPPAPNPPSAHSDEDQAPHLIPLSASSTAALAQSAGLWSAAMGQAGSVRQVAATAAHRRDHHHGARAVVLADSAPQAAQAWDAAAQGRTHLSLAGPRRPAHKPLVVFVYPGHGAHPATLSGHHGLEAEPVFTQALERARLAAFLESDQGEAAGLARVQPAQWAWQVAATALLASWGVRPDVVVGHSLGELAAAHTAGVLTLHEAALVVAQRSRLLEQTAPKGELLATSLDPARAQELVRSLPTVAVASINAANATVLSGPIGELDLLADQLAKSGVWTRRISDAPPAHGPLVADQAEQLPDLVKTIRPRPATTALWSTATAARAQGPEWDAAYWGRQLRSPVLLHKTVRALAEQERPVVVVEVGARSVLASALASTLAQAQRRYEVDPPLVCTDGPAAPRENLLMALGQLYTFGLNPSWPTPSTPTAAPLPLRAWTHHSSAAPQNANQVVELSALETERARTVITERVTALVRGLLPQGSALPQGDAVLAEAGLGSLALAHLHIQLIHQLPDLAGLPAHVVHQATTMSALVKAITQFWAPAHLAHS